MFVMIGLLRKAHLEEEILVRRVLLNPHTHLLILYQSHLLHQLHPYLILPSKAKSDWRQLTSVGSIINFVPATVASYLFRQLSTQRRFGDGQLIRDILERSLPFPRLPLLRHQQLEILVGESSGVDDPRSVKAGSVRVAAA
jgi:hypothetical protein